MMKNLKYFKLMVVVFLPLIILSCQDTTEQIKIDYPTQLDGQWTIVQSFSTNGPICFFLDPGNQISFEISPLDSGVHFNYNTGKQERSDYFKYELIGNKIVCEGEYSTSSHVEPIFVYDSVLPQYLDIEFLDENRIHCNFRMATILPYTNEIHVGNISNFIATKN